MPTPAEIASRAAALAAIGGTKSTDASMRCSLAASATLSCTGTPPTSRPPLPGLTPATTTVPHSDIRWDQ